MKTFCSEKQTTVVVLRNRPSVRMPVVCMLVCDHTYCLATNTWAKGLYQLLLDIHECWSDLVVTFVTQWRLRHSVNQVYVTY